MSPKKKLSSQRAIVFIDGQNLYYGAKEALGCTHPNFDAMALARAVCDSRGWKLEKVCFYTGVPEPADNQFWHDFWSAKLAQMGRQGVRVFSRALRYRNKRVPGGGGATFLVGEEKGIDVRIALDIIRAAHRKECDVVLVFSQDQDLSEVAREIRLIAREQKRRLRIACAYPLSPTTRNKRGIDGTDWIEISRDTYNTCIDVRDYRSKKGRPASKRE